MDIYTKSAHLIKKKTETSLTFSEMFAWMTTTLFECVLLSVISVDVFKGIFEDWKCAWVGFEVGIVKYINAIS